MMKDLEQEHARAAVKASAAAALERLGLTPFVSLDEIEQELRRVETAFQSLLLLGILRRIMAREDDEAAKLFIPAATEWKNYLPHKELGGLTPFEYRGKYPAGSYEARYMTGLMEEYQAKLEASGEKERETPDIQEDFAAFQNRYFDRAPLEQPFLQNSGTLMTLREIIIEERRRNGYPENTRNKIGMMIFAENTAEGMGLKTAELDDAYREAVVELDAMRQGQISRNRRRILKFAEFFKKIEPYHRCGPEPYRFYLNYASALFLIGDAAQSLCMLDKALAHNPDYRPAREVKERIMRWGKAQENEKPNSGKK